MEIGSFAYFTNLRTPNMTTSAVKTEPKIKIMKLVKPLIA
jgi:hypothetical protein